MSDLKDLIKQRGQVRARLTLFEKYLTPLLDSNQTSAVIVNELRLRCNKMRDFSCNFEEIQSQIEMLDEDTTKQMEEREITENVFYSLIARAQSLLELFESQQKVESSSHTSSKCNNVKLPPLKIPSFNGNPNNWLSFRDTYLSLIHKNENVDNVNKFHYLKSYLEGSAISVINSITVSSDNYEIAWSLLCERFDNKCLLINEHIKCLFSIESLTKESHIGIRNLIDTLSKNINALKTLGEPTDKWDTLIIYMASAKLDSTTARTWEELRSAKISPTLEEFYTFLRQRATVLETVTASKLSSCNNSKPDKRHSLPNNIKTFHSSSGNMSQPIKQCPVCKQNHRIYECSIFKSIPVEERIAELTQLKLCLNCLRSGHNPSQCRLGGCRICHKKHNTLIHKQQSIPLQVNNNNDIKENNLPDPAVDSTPSRSSVLVTMSATSFSQALLPTALVTVKINNNTYTLRALLDSGSQNSFISARVQRELGLQTKNNSYQCVSGIGSTIINVTTHCNLQLHSFHNPFNIRVKCFVLPQITDHLPHVAICTQDFNIPSYVQLADPTFNKPSNIDLLLGADIFWDILESGRIVLGPQRPILHETKLGWVVAGPTAGVYCSNTSSKIHCHFSKKISQQLTKFWELEEIPSNTEHKTDDGYCEQLFNATTRREKDGRFCVQIPLKHSTESLGESYDIAEKRLIQLERKLKNNLPLKQHYHKFIHEYETLGHMSEILRPEFGCYLPHHGVVRNDSETTKLRVVFDASAKTTSGKSFNDLQFVGPVVQDDLFSIILRYRQHRYVVSADIEKMYRQISVEPQQRHLQLILWRDDPTEKIKIFQLNTVTYGTASAPFLSTRCLLQLSKECHDSKCAQLLREDFYVDDFLSGAETESELRSIIHSITSILNSACLPLRKWRKNIPHIFDNELEITQPKIFDLSSQSSVLGLKWDPSKDVLQFSVDMELKQPTTKRAILSKSAKLFDPLGLLSPCTIIPKIILQKLWLSKLDWDDPVENTLQEEWNCFASNLNSISDFQIPRCILIPKQRHVEVHSFSDASQVAYAAAIYLRSIDDAGQVLIRLLCAKTKVAPVKAPTIPRLELCGALLSARLSAKVLKTLRCKVASVVYWTDSTVVLGWLSSHSCDLKPFVSNSVSEIQDLTTTGVWRHVPGNSNPADLASRGTNPRSIKSAMLWWDGPSFLAEDPSKWPQNIGSHNTSELPERKTNQGIKMTTSLQCTTASINTLAKDRNYTKFIDFDRCSQFSRLHRAVAYVMRFIHNTRNPKLKLSGSFTKTELDTSLNILIKHHQYECFPNEIKILKCRGNLPSRSHILSLSPFLNENGMLCVGGRLRNSKEPFEKKHPFLLDTSHNFTKLLFIYHHLKLLHCGPQLLLSNLRSKFWPLRGRILARRTVNNCKPCKLMKAKSFNPIMGNLPSNRVSPNLPFHISGVDFAGPFFVADRKGRGCRISKCYLCLFICFSTKALHLEVASDLTTDIFILCLRRFISRRGKPLQLYCDNGTNFVGANNEITKFLKLHNEDITSFASDEGIQFKFSPAYSPHFGGLWEAGVKSAKHHLIRILGDKHLTFEELSTLFTQIEAILNSRPLTPLSSDPNDLDPLTPAHFLIGKPLTSLPSETLLDTNPNRLSRYQLLEKMRQHFWERWRNEYLNELQQKTKWQTQQRGFQEGDLVVIKEPNTPPLKWRMARVAKLFPGADGTPRVADISTSKGIIRRAVHNLCPLDIQSSASTRNLQAFEEGEDVRA